MDAAAARLPAITAQTTAHETAFRGNDRGIGQTRTGTLPRMALAAETPQLPTAAQSPNGLGLKWPISMIAASLGPKEFWGEGLLASRGPTSQTG